ncbi:MAG: RNA polymerase sigma factor [Saprospiraceae bacterium]
MTAEAVDFTMLKFFRRNATGLSDDELVQLYRKTEDLEHLGLLYERYVELVLGVCLKFFKNRTLAEDAVMNIFEALVVKVKTQDIRQFRPWLHVVTKNYCLMQLRKRNRTVSFDEMPPAEQAEVVHFAGTVHPVDDFEDDGKEAALKECLEKLNEQQRQCVVKFYYEGKSYKQIADERGELLGMVRSNIQNGRRNLRICIEKKRGERSDVLK